MVVCRNLSRPLDDHGAWGPYPTGLQGCETSTQNQHVLHVQGVTPQWKFHGRWDIRFLQCHCKWWWCGWESLIEMWISENVGIRSQVGQMWQIHFALCSCCTETHLNLQQQHFRIKVTEDVKCAYMTPVYSGTDSSPPVWHRSLLGFQPWRSKIQITRRLQNQWDVVFSTVKEPYQGAPFWQHLIALAFRLRSLQSAIHLLPPAISDHLSKCCFTASPKITLTWDICGAGSDASFSTGYTPPNTNCSVPIGSWLRCIAWQWLNQSRAPHPMAPLCVIFSTHLPAVARRGVSWGGGAADVGPYTPLSALSSRNPLTEMSSQSLRRFLKGIEVGTHCSDSDYKNLVDLREVLSKTSPVFFALGLRSPTSTPPVAAAFLHIRH